MKITFKHKILTGIAMVAALFLCSACNDEWDDHYKDKGINSNQTLLDVIKSDAELSDFYEVAQACGICDSLLNASRVYTMWVPVNDAVNKDSLLQEISEGNRDEVLVRFIEAHMSDFMHAANGVKEVNPVLLLNKKVVNFAGDGSEYTFNNIPLIMDGFNSNQRVRNGILHKLSKSVEYKMNVWEYLATDERIDSLSNFLYSFNVRKFNQYASIQGPTVNGSITYLDSVFDTSNMWFSTYGSREAAGFGDISNEDSLYTMFAITNDVWNEMVPKVTAYYNFFRDTTNAYIYDSIQHVSARKALVNYLVFSDKEQKFVENPGEMIANYRYYATNFTTATGEVRRTFPRAELMAGVIDSAEMSNGKVYVTNEFSYSPLDLWLDTIKIEGETFGDWLKYNSLSTNVSTASVTTATRHDSISGKISNNLYMSVAPIGDVFAKVTYVVPNTLSAGKYKIGVVMVPPAITDKNADYLASKPTKMRVQIETRNADGKVVEVYNTDDGRKKNNGLQNDPTRVDTVYLYDLEFDDECKGDPALRRPTTFSFDFSEYGLTADQTKTTITFTNDCKRVKEYNEWQANLLIDCILLIPVTDEEENENEDVSGE